MVRCSFRKLLFCHCSMLIVTNNYIVYVSWTYIFSNSSSITTTKLAKLFFFSFLFLMLLFTFRLSLNLSAPLSIPARAWAQGSDAYMCACVRPCVCARVIYIAVALNCHCSRADVYDCRYLIKATFSEDRAKHLCAAARLSYIMKVLSIMVLYSRRNQNSKKKQFRENVRNSIQENKLSFRGLSVRLV